MCVHVCASAVLAVCARSVATATWCYQCMCTLGFVTQDLVQNPSELTHFGRLCPEEPKGVGVLLQLLLRRAELAP